MNFNFIRDRKRKLKIKYLGVDFAFMVISSFILMMIVSYFFSLSSDENIQVEKHIKQQINTLNLKVSEYPVVKKQRDKLLDMSSDLAHIKASRFYLLLGIEKISRSITDNLYITKLSYVAGTDSVILSGQVKDLKLLSVFMKNLEVEFSLEKVDLKSLSSEKNGERSFVLEFVFGEANEFTGYHVL